MRPTLQFLGAAGTVTGSRHLLTYNGYRALVDCGLFQGAELKELNWEPFPIPVREIDAIVLTHGHIDHIGYLPRLVKHGYRGPVYASPGTIDLCKLSLPDSAKLQEEDARYANKSGYSRHRPALPLYDVTDARRALMLLQTVRYEQRLELTRGLSFRFLRAGHILGSCFVEMHLGNGRIVLFSGDLGRFNQPVIRDPDIVTRANYLVLESTYGDRLHGDGDPKTKLAQVVNQTAEREGMLIIPAFAIGRTQQVLYYLRELELDGRIPALPTYVDSPMAVDATRLFAKHTEDHDIEMESLLADGNSPFRSRNLTLARDSAQSRYLNRLQGPGIIISSSGMMTGGRIMHHVKLRAPDPRNTLLFVGFQAEGTKGRSILDGAEEIRIHGETVPVRAHVERIEEFSQHADYAETLEWLSHFRKPPKHTHLVHGEPAAASALKNHIANRYHWQVSVAERGDEVELG